MEIAQADTEDGYKRVTLRLVEGDQVTFRVHRLVAEAFVPVPEGLGGDPTVNHKDCVKDHNHSDNLEWVTHAENIELAWANGLNDHHFGERHDNCQHTDEVVHAVCRGLQAGRSARAIAEELGLKAPFVHGIKRRETRVAVSSGYFW